jgi:hypothetical protein
MATKKNSRTPQVKNLGAKSPKKGKPAKAAAASGPAQERFVRDLLVRGEAQKPTRGGKLPSEATHAITKESKTGEVKVKRARFKYF